MSPIARVQAWLREQDRSQADLARSLDVFPSRICDWLKGRRRLSAAIADRLETETGGAITMREVVRDDARRFKRAAQRQSRNKAKGTQPAGGAR